MGWSAATRQGNARRKLCGTCDRRAAPLAACPTGDWFHRLTAAVDDLIIAVAAGGGRAPVQRDGVGADAATVTENVARQSEMRTRFALMKILRALLTSAQLTTVWSRFGRPSSSWGFRTVQLPMRAASSGPGNGRRRRSCRALRRN